MKRIAKQNKAIYILGLAVFLFTATFSTTGCGESSPAEENTTAEKAPVHKASDPLARGEELYISYCKICHGMKGEEGPMADMLKVQPPDMSLIAARRDGNFSEEELLKVIDGTEQVKGHGHGDMPIWGKVFKRAEDLETDEEMQEEFKKIVLYLKSIQREMPAPEAPTEDTEE